MYSTGLAQIAGEALEHLAAIVGELVAELAQQGADRGAEFDELGAELPAVVGRHPGKTLPAGEALPHLPRQRQRVERGQHDVAGREGIEHVVPPGQTR